MMTFMAGPAGRLEAAIDEGTGRPRAAAVLASPDPQLGGTFQDKVLFSAARGLARLGCATLRFNYRGVGLSDGTWDGGRGEQDDYRAALDWAGTRWPGTPLWAVGYSFGSWIALRAGAVDPRVALLVGIAPPVDSYDYAPAAASGKPVFLVHGSLDAVAPSKSVQRFYGSLAEPREIVVIDGADHAFDGHVSEVGEALEDLLGGMN
jgi:alpha/beta superfamily hydrolase